jgi:O-antigen ligase
MLAPVWATPVSSAEPLLTYGRVGFLLVTGMLVYDLARARTRLAAPHLAVLVRGAIPGLPGLVLAAGLLAGVVVTGVSADLHNTLRTAGSFFGYCELVGVILVTICILRLTPRFAMAVLAATALGSLIADATALTGLQGASFGMTSRPTGPFGNPNYLAFATALAVVVMLGAQLTAPRMLRVAIFVVLPLPLAVLLLTYSRTGLIVLATGSLAVLTFALPRGRKRVLVVGVAALATVAAAAIVYPRYSELRLRADFAAALADPAPDRSGWDTRAQGPITAGSARLGNPAPGVLEVMAAHAGAGVSRAVEVAKPTSRYTFTVTVHAVRSGTPFAMGLEDNTRGNGPTALMTSLSPTPQRLSVTWRPTRLSTAARVYLWAPRDGGSFAISDPALSVAPGNPRSVAHRQLLSTTLLGRPSSHSAYSEQEQHFIASRLAAAKYALRLFSRHPLVGVGWERFDSFAAPVLKGSDPGSTHDEYLRIAAELGLAGLLCLAICAAGLGLGVRRLRRGSATAAQRVAVGPVVGACAGLPFINALVTPSITLTFAAAVAVLCAQPPKPRQVLARGRAARLAPPRTSARPAEPQGVGAGVAAPVDEGGEITRRAQIAGSDQRGAASGQAHDAQSPER